MSLVFRRACLLLACAGCGANGASADDANVRVSGSLDAGDAASGQDSAIKETADAGAIDGAERDANGGGDAALPDVDQCPDASPMGRWSDLYNCYFGPSGIANCGSTAGCHDVASDDGAEGSGFVCGSLSLTCWQGMNASVLANKLPIVFDADGGPLDPTGSTLWSALRKTTGAGLDNMPFNPTTVVFSSPDMARIAAWIGRGTPND